MAHLHGGTGLVDLLAAGAAAFEVNGGDVGVGEFGAGGKGFDGVGAGGGQEPAGPERGRGLDAPRAQKAGWGYI